MKTILITGNGGYIGSHLCRLLQPNYRIVGLDLNSSQYKIHDHISADIRKIKLVPYEIDTIIHLAALVRVNDSVMQPLDYYSTNLNGTINVLDKIKCRNFIFASTGSAEYCNNPYAVSKRAAEDCVRQYCLDNNISWTSFRFYNVIGSNGFAPTNSDGLFYNLIRASQSGLFQLFGGDYNTRDGTAERDYVHVEEICAAIEKAITQPANGLENLGHGQGHTVNEIIDLFKQVNSVNFEVIVSPRRIGDLERSVLSNPSDYLPTLYDFRDYVRMSRHA
jgi:UDP-glucose 4-epimerase